MLNPAAVFALTVLVMEPAVLVTPAPPAFQSHATFVRLPEVTNVYLKPKMDALEQMVAAMYLAHWECSSQLKRTMRQCKASFGEDSQVFKLATTLHLLLTEYAPCLFTLGKAVRECYWDLQAVNTGERARTLLAFCLNLLLALERTHKNEYCRVLGVALVQWSAFHGHLPAAFFMEEVNQASLSRLAQFCTTDLRRHTVAQFSEAYAALGPSPKVIQLTRPHMSDTLSQKVVHRVEHSMYALERGLFPVVGPGVNKAVGRFDRSVDIYVPRSPLHDVTSDQISHAVQHGVLLLLQSEPMDAALRKELAEVCRFAPVVDDRGMSVSNEVRQQAIGALRRSLGVAASRRKNREGEAAMTTDSQVAADGGEASVAASSGTSTAVLLQDDDAVMVGEQDVATDAGGESPPARSPSPACTEGEHSYESDDSRSAACTSGSEDA